VWSAACVVLGVHTHPTHHPHPLHPSPPPPPPRPPPTPTTTQHQARRCWPRPLLVRRACRSCPSAALTSWRCLWVSGDDEGQWWWWWWGVCVRESNAKQAPQGGGSHRSLACLLEHCLSLPPPLHHTNRCGPRACARPVHPGAQPGGLCGCVGARALQATASCV
jgi:hypothetical protein